MTVFGITNSDKKPNAILSEKYTYASAHNTVHILSEVAHSSKTLHAIPFRDLWARIEIRDLF